MEKEGFSIAEKAIELKEQLEREKREKLEKDHVYKTCTTISKVMDRYMVDPILGLMPGGVFDIISQVMALPFIYVAATRLKSFSLTLAMIYNSLIDALVGAVPLIGDLADILHRSHKKNHRLLTGFIENDEEVKQQVKKDSIKCGIGIVVLIVLIYLMFRLMGYVWDQISYAWDQFLALFS